MADLPTPLPLDECRRLLGYPQLRDAQVFEIRDFLDEIVTQMVADFVRAGSLPEPAAGRLPTGSRYHPDAEIDDLPGKTS